MRLLALLVALSACAAEIPPPPAGTCTRNAKLPHPPAPGRSIPRLVAWANTAANVANQALDERDLCYGSYQRLEDWARSIKR